MGVIVLVKSTNWGKWVNLNCCKFPQQVNLMVANSFEFMKRNEEAENPFIEQAEGEKSKDQGDLAFTKENGGRLYFAVQAEQVEPKITRHHNRPKASGVSDEADSSWHQIARVLDRFTSVLY